MRKTGWVGLLFVVVVVLACAGVVHAQGTAAITGRVVDSSGSAVAGATVTATSQETRETRTETSDDGGLYRLLSLPVGAYSLKVDKDGFTSQTVNGINLVVGQEAAINVTLQVGGVSQEVTVTAEAPSVNTTTAQTSGLVAEEQVKDLPLNGRSFDSLITLNSGTANLTTLKTTGTYGGLGNEFSISGRRLTDNLFLLNGIQIEGNGSQADTPGSVSGQLLGIDAVREFNVLTENYSAEYGKKVGGQISIVTMSGTNALHGSLFDFLRNSDMDARNFFDQAPFTVTLPGRIPHFVRNNFGGSMGGPIWKDKSFIFGNYEGLRFTLGQSDVANVPDLLARSEAVPATAPYFAMWHLPNGPAGSDNTATFTAQYLSSPPQTIREDFGTVRFDQIFSNKDTFYAVDTTDDGKSTTIQPAGTFANDQRIRTQTISASEVHIFSPSILNTFTAGFSRNTLRSDAAIQLVPLPGVTPFYLGQEVGTIKINAQAGGQSSATFASPGGAAPSRTTRNLFTYTDSVQIVHGIHQISVGVWFQRMQDNRGNAVSSGTASFANISALINGSPASTVQITQIATPLGFREWLGAWYISDTMKLRSNLTVTAGLRHEFTNGYGEQDCRVSNYVLDPTQTFFLANPATGCNLISDNKAKFLFAPRLGIAWDVFGHGSTVIHVGAGMYYQMLDNLSMYPNTNAPYNVQLQGNNIPFPFNPPLSATNATGFVGAAIAPLNVPPNIKTPQVISQNIKIEQRLGAGFAISVGYNGIHSYDNYVQNDYNTSYPAICGDAVQPFPTTFTCPTGAVGINNQYNVYYPNGLPAGTAYYGSGSIPRRQPALSTAKLFTNIGTSFYNAGTVELTKQMGRGLSMKANYTWSHGEDDSSFQGPLNNGIGVLLNPLNPKQDWSDSDYDIRNRFSVTAAYQFPFGKGKPIWNNAGSFADRVIGGWGLQTIVTVQSGLPLNPELGIDQVNNGDNNAPDRPSVNPNFTGNLYPDAPIATGQTGIQWFDPAAFIMPLKGTYGNAPRNFLRGPGLTDADLSLLKDIPINERFKAQFRAEAFNVANHTNLGTPNFSTLNTTTGATFGAPLEGTGGVITTTATTSRQLQMALKLIW